ncbi:MAG: OmpA family protein [Pseudomonadota bacterium]
MSDNVQDKQETRVETTRRYTRRRAGAAAFFPMGLIPIGGLLLLSLIALAPFAHHTIEDNVERASLAALRDAGENWATVQTSGQRVFLRGEAPSLDRAANAVRVVREARAPTPFGSARPVIRVFDRTYLASPRLSDTTLEEERQTQPEPSPDETAIPVEVDQAAECERAIAALFLDSKIEFATGSARIAEVSGRLLDQLTARVATCDVAMVIEGHTDSTGSASLNDQLSLARANAVRDALIERGIPPERIVAEGFGSSQPLTSNATQAGRERNRRIEFKVQVPDDPE